MEENNPKTKEKDSCLSSSVLMNLIWGREQLSVPLWSNKNLYKEFPIGLQELILILPKTRIPSRDEETQFDIATQGESRTICPNP
jgi:hypothetical protein